MRAKLVFVSDQKQSEHGGDYYVLRFKADDGWDYSTHVYLTCRNWPGWEALLQPGFDKTTLLEGFVLLKGYKDKFDADWPPQPVNQPESVKTVVESGPVSPISPNPGLQAGLFGDRWTSQQAALQKARQEAGV